jgi:D-lactate dehydrogenase
MKVAVFSTKTYDKEYLDKANEDNRHDLVYFESSLKPKTVKLAENFDAVCVFVNDMITKEVIESLVSLQIKLIVLRCAGFNNVDIESACNNNIKVLRVPAYSPNAVAEHAVALIMTLNRKTHKAYNRVREGCKVLAYDVYPDKELMKNSIQYLPLYEVLKMSDILSLHCPLTPETNRMINKDSLNLMKKGVMLINTSRGKLIDTDAAIEALKEGLLGYLGIDVYEQEEKLFFKDLSEIIILDDKISRLMTFPNVLVTAHQAYFTDNALTQIANTTIRNLTDYEHSIINNQHQVCINMIK